MISTLIILMFVLLLLGFPMVMTLLLSSLLTMIIFMPDIELFTIVQQMILGVGSPVLMAIPMFILAADIMCTGKTSKRLLNFVESFVGHISGGLATTTSITCALFGAISGSTQATVVAVGRPVREKMLSRGYSDSESMALIMTSSNLAYLIPPSLGMVVYGVASGASIGDLFIAGLGPAIILVLFFAIYSTFYARIKKIPYMDKARWHTRLITTRKSLLAFGFPLIIMGGIYSGIFSPTEAAAVSVLYAFIVEVFIYKSIKIKEIYHVALSTGIVTTVVFILVAVGNAFSWIISYARIPQLITENLLGSSPTVFSVLLAVNIAFFIGGMFMETVVIILILTPLFAPIASSVGINLVHLGIIVTLQSAIGTVTPPFGTSIFTVCAIFNQPFIKAVRNLLPYLLILLLTTIMVSAIPEISLLLVRMMR